MRAREPVAVIAAVETLALAILGLIIIVFKIEPTIAGALVAVVGGGIAVLTSLFTRSKVTPVNS